MRKLLAFIIICCGISAAQNARYDGQAIGTRGPIPFASVAVCSQPANTSSAPCSPLASLCSSLADASCIQPNPVAADNLGNFHFYVKQSQTPVTVQIYGTQVATPYVMTDQQPAVGSGSTIVITGSQSLASAVAACPVSGTIVITPGTYPVTSNLSIPSTCGLRIYQGGVISVSNAVTLTIGGSVAAGLYQIFSGAGTVTGLSTVYPEWFGSNAINAKVQSAFGANGGTLVLQPNTSYTSSFSTAAGANGWTVSNVWFKGGGQPIANAGTTALTAGTIITGGLSFCSANNIHITDLGVDAGAAVMGTSTVDGLAVAGLTSCTGVNNPAEALVTGTYIANVTCMLSSGAVAFHCMRVEHATGAYLSNVVAYFGFHGLAFKSINSQVDGVTAYGNNGEGFITKADTYTSTANVTARNIRAQTLTAANRLNVGVMIDGENGVPITNVNVLGAQVINAQSGLVFVANTFVGTGAVSNVNVSGLTYATNSNSLGLTQSVCVTNGTGVGGNTSTLIHISNIDCINTVGALNTVPMLINMNCDMCQFDNMHISGANGTGSTINGNPLTLNGWTSENDTQSSPFTIGATTVFNLKDYESAVPLTSVGITLGGVFNSYTPQVTGGVFRVSSGIVFSPNIMKVTALATPTAIPGTLANAGILVVRDNTSAGTATFVIDPNSGATSIAGTVTGLAAAGVTFASGHWNITLTAGATPRNLEWVILAGN